MLFTNNLSTCFRRNIKSLIHMSTNVTPVVISFKPKFSKEDEQKILLILNESNSEQLSKFDLTRARLKNLESWRTKHGRFRSLSEVLEVEGLGEKVLERFCNSIIFDRQDSIIVPVASKNLNNLKNRRQILTPQLPFDLADRLNNAVGVHLAPTSVSWAKICTDQNELQTWGYHDFSSLPKKMLPTDTFDLAMAVLSKIPISDLYIMESTPNQQVQGSKPMAAYNQHLELSSMLLALLNTSPKHNLNIDSSISKELQFGCENRVFFLRANLPARLFRTLVGTERVATTGIIAQLLDNDKTLPCTSISVQQSVRDHYSGQNPVQREVMGQALMLGITFIDLCVYKNPISAAAIVPGRRPNT